MTYPTKVKKQKIPDLNLLAVHFAWNEKRQLTIFLLYSEVCILIYFIEFKFWTPPTPPRPQGLLGGGAGTQGCSTRPQGFWIQNCEPE